MGLNLLSLPRLSLCTFFGDVQTLTELTSVKGKEQYVQPKDRILDVYGSFGHEVGGWLAIGDLIELLANVEVDAQAVRSAASRMKRKGLLVSEKRNGVAGYALSDSATEILEFGSHRIFGDVGTEPAVGGADWIVVLFSVPESERSKRYLIRSRLERLGFGQGPATSWLAPVTVLAETERMLQRHDLGRYVTIWQGRYVGFDDLEELVANSWDLEGIRHRFDDYIGTFAPVAKDWAKNERSDSEAFAAYIGQNAHWRELPYLDPGLPVDALPSDWPGKAARQLFLSFERVLRPQALRYFRQVTKS